MQAARTRSMVEGALLAAVTALLGLLSFYTGFGWLQPLPVLLAYLRLGPRRAALVALVASTVLALWIGPLAALGTFGFVVALGLTAGWSVSRGWGAGATIMLMTLALLALAIVGVVSADLLWHQNLWAETWRRFVQLVDARASTLARFGLTPGVLVSTVRAILPVAATLAAGFQAAGVYALARAVLGRLGHSLPAVPALHHWRLPAWLAWPYLAILGAAAAGARLHQQVPVQIAWNLLLALSLAYTVTGLAAGYGWLRSRGVTRAWAAAALLGATSIIGALGFSLALPVGGLLASQLTVRPAPAGRGDGGDAR